MSAIGLAGAFRAAVIETLRQSTDVQALFGTPARVYDQQPKGAAFPYVAASRLDVRPRAAAMIEAVEVRLDLEVMARWSALRDVSRMTAIVAQALETAGPMSGVDPGWRVVLLQPVLSDVFRQADPVLLRGFLRLKAVIEAA